MFANSIHITPSNDVYVLYVYRTVELKNPIKRDYTENDKR
jgi:hypothetical protein